MFFFNIVHALKHYYKPEYKKALSTFTHDDKNKAITVTQAESTNPTQATVNKLLQTDGSLNVGTDVTITFNANERKATLASAPDSTKVQGSVVFTNVTVEKQDLSTFTKPTTETITVTQAESTNPTQATVNKFLQTPDTLTVGTDVTITFNANERKATLAVVANSTRAQGDNVVFTNVTVEKPQLNTFTHDDKNKAITVTQAESTNPTQATVNKFLQTPDTLTINTDVTITFNANERKATLAVVANSTRAQGDNVVFTNVTVEKPQLNTFTHDDKNKAITVTQAESTNPTQATVNKFLQTPDTLTINTDVTITFNANERKATLAVVANSTKAQGSVVFTNVTVEKQDLSTFTKPTTETITVTQAEVTSKDQNALNKFLKQAGSLTVNTDATIEFDTTNKKATITATPNSTQAKGSVVFTNVKVEKQDLSTFTKTPTDQAITVTQAESTNPTQATVNKFLQTPDTLTINTDVTITFNANERKATLAVVANSTRAQGDNVVFTNVTVEKQDLSTFTKTPTDQAITVTQAESTNPTQATVNKFLQTPDTLTINTDVTITFNANERKATLAVVANSTRAQGDNVVFTNVTVEKQDLSTFTKPTTETITVTQAEVTSKDQNALNKFLKQAGSLTVNTDATIEFDTTNKKATITATPNSTQAKGSVVFTNVTVEKQDLSTFTKPTTETITVTQAESTNPTQATVNKLLQTDGSLNVGTDVTITFNANERKATLAVVANSTKVQGSVVFTNVTVEKQDLSTFTKPTTETITVTQAEVTSKDQNALNKFLKQAGSLTVNTDATIEFDTTNKKATITATPNSTQAKGNVVFTNVTVENPTQNPVSVQTPPTNNQNTEESSNNNKTILICLTIFLTITLTVLIGLFIHNSKKQK
ncbi:hypothetical protein [Candidatus Phytoplasma solani]|uniref:hypothetical protein n=1 Tax=Candidatus Phytoplasma solani TaxID=69896 RepID=UPI00358DD9E3